MKRTNIILLILLVTGMMFTSCKKDYPEVGDMASKAEGIQGTWKAEKVMQVDYDALEKGEDLYQWNVSSAFNLTDFIITFNADGTFAISGTAHNFAKITSGTWTFDDPAYPTKVQIANGGTTDAFALLAPPKKGWDSFILSYDRYSAGKKIIGYQYHLKKQ
jgi:hypothetical protein